MLRNTAPRGSSRATRCARVLRRTMSLPEVLLWRSLRRNPSGIKFRRRHPCGPYILDFFCSDARLAIEVDGEAHNRGARPIRDPERDAWLAEAGITVLRLPARDVLADHFSVAENIISATVARLPLHHPAAPGGPPPRAELGED